MTKFQINRDHEESDPGDADRKSDLPELVFLPRFPDQGTSLLDRFLPRRGRLLEGAATEGMDISARLLQGVSHFAQLIVDRFHIQTSLRQFLGDGGEVVPSVIDLGDRLVKIVRCLDALGIVLGVLAMAIAAQGAGLGREHRIIGPGNRMVAMALTALSPVMLVESLFVFTAVEEARIRGVAKVATVADRRDTRREGGMISVTIIAGGRAHITVFEQRTTVDAGLKLGQLSGRERGAIRERESGHGLGIGVTRAAGFGHALSVNFRLGILGRANAMDAMAADAGGRPVVMFHKQQFSVLTFLELR